MRLKITTLNLHLDTVSVKGLENKLFYPFHNFVLQSKCSIDFSNDI